MRKLLLILIGLALLTLGLLYTSWWFTARQQAGVLTSSGGQNLKIEMNHLVKASEMVLGMDIFSTAAQPNQPPANPAKLATKLSAGINMRIGLGIVVCLIGLGIVVVGIVFKQVPHKPPS